MSEVRPGQVWADNDPRNAGRLLRVESVHPADDHRSEPYARVTVQKVSRNVTRTEVGEQRTILLRRMRPTRNGYRLVEDVTPAQQVEDPYPKETAVASEVADRLDEAADIILQRGWTQERTYGHNIYDSPATLLGALVFAFSARYGDGWEETAEFSKAYEVLHAQLDGVLASEAGLTAWNHAEGRTQEDVVEVLRRASQVARSVSGG